MCVLSNCVYHLHFDPYWNISCICYYIIGIQRRAGFTPWWTRWHRGLLWHASLIQEPPWELPSWLTPSLTARCSANSCSVRRRLLVHVLVQLFFWISKNSAALSLHDWSHPPPAPCVSSPCVSRCSFPWSAPAIFPHWSHISSTSTSGHAASPKHRAADPETGPGTTVDPSSSPPLPHPGRVLQVRLRIKDPEYDALKKTHKHAIRWD